MLSDKLIEIVDTLISEQYSEGKTKEKIKELKKLSCELIEKARHNKKFEKLITAIKNDAHAYGIKKIMGKKTEKSETFEKNINAVKKIIKSKSDQSTLYEAIMIAYRVEVRKQLKIYK